MKRITFLLVLLLVTVVALNGCKKKEKENQEPSSNIESVTPDQSDKTEAVQTDKTDDSVLDDDTKGPKPNAQKGTDSKEDESTSIKDVITIIEETTDKDDPNSDSEVKEENTTSGGIGDNEPETDSENAENPFDLDKDDDGYIDGWH